MSGDRFDSLAAALVAAAFKVLLERQEKEPPPTPPDIASALCGTFAGGREQRALARAIEAATDQLASHLQAFDATRLGSVPDARKDQLVAGIVRALAALRMTRSGMAELAPRGERLDRRLRQDAVRSWVEAGLEPDTRRFGSMLLRHATQYVESIVRHLATAVGEAGQVPVGLLTHEVERGLSEGVRSVRIPTSNHPGVSDEDSEFEARYATEIIQAYDTMQLFGIDVPDSLRRQPVDIGYITLQSSARDTWRPDGASRASVHTMIAGACRARRYHSRTSAGRERADEDGPLPYRVLLTGAAGSGKTTVTQWLALGAARSGYPEALQQWQDLLPFVVQLRYLFSDGKPRPLEISDLARVRGRRVDGTTGGWVTDKLEHGRALVILDGFDELPPLPHPHRAQVTRWIEKLAADFPRAKLIVTSRPEGLDSSWFTQRGFEQLELEAMSLPAIQNFVHRWYYPLLSSAPNPGIKDVHLASRDRLLEHIGGRPLVRDLAETPLLCAMLCAFYAVNETVEPKGRAHLYEQVISALTNREIKRKVPGADQIELQDKRAFLQAIARYMADNALTTLRLRPLADFSPTGSTSTPDGASWAELRRHDRADMTVRQLLVEPLSSFLSSRTTVDQALIYVVHRSAVLQQVGGGEVQFAHRTFQEYLAACAYADHGEVLELVPKLLTGDAIWWRITAFAAARCNRRDASALVRRLMIEADRNPARRRDIQLLIAECLSAARVELKTAEAVRFHLAEIFPPRDRDEAAKLVRSSHGDHVLGWLAGHADDQAAAEACIVAAALIGTPEALTLVRDYAAQLSVNGVTPSWVRDLLTEMWDRFDAVTYARRVLSEVEFDGHAVHIDTPAKALAVGELARVRRITFGKGADSTAAQVRRWKGLRRIEELDCTAVRLHSLDGIEDLGTLTSLGLRAGELLRDFSPLTALRGLQTLHLLDCGHLTNGSVLAPLVRLRNLRLDDTAFDDWAWLGPLEELRNLQLSGGRLRDIRALGHLQGLRTLRLAPGAGVADLSGLSDLRNLRRLSVRLAADRSGAPALWASPETRLREVALDGWPTTADLDGLAGCGVLTSFQSGNVAGLHSLASLAPLRTLRRLSLHDCRTLTDIGALSDMRGLRHLDLSGSAVRDLAPLAGLKNLEEVVLERCSALEGIRALLDLPSLRHVSFDGITDWLPMDVIEELKDARSVNVLFDSYLNVGHAGA